MRKRLYAPAMPTRPSCLAWIKTIRTSESGDHEANTTHTDRRRAGYPGFSFRERAVERPRERAGDLRLLQTEIRSSGFAAGRIQRGQDRIHGAGFIESGGGSTYQ